MKKAILVCLVLSTSGCATYRRWNNALSGRESQQALQNLSDSENRQPDSKQKSTNCVTRERTDFAGRPVYYTDCDTPN